MSKFSNYANPQNRSELELCMGIFEYCPQVYVVNPRKSVLNAHRSSNT